MDRPLGITLWQLRRGTTVMELSYHYGISMGLTLIHRFTVTWISFMFKRFDSIQDVTRDTHKPLPISLRNSLFTWSGLMRG